MFEPQKPTKKIKELCSMLGADYSIKVIDLEQVIYHKINNNYDIEISGLNNNRKAMNATIYLWQINPTERILETISDITTFESLKSSLSSLVEKYQNLN